MKRNDSPATNPSPRELEDLPLFSVVKGAESSNANVIEEATPSSDIPIGDCGKGVGESMTPASAAEGLLLHPVAAEAGRCCGGQNEKEESGREATGVPEQEEMRPRLGSVTLAMAARLEEAAEMVSTLPHSDRAKLRRWARRMRKCVAISGAQRCEGHACPRCRGRKSRRHLVRELTRKVRASSPSNFLYLVTATVAESEPARGYRVLTKSFSTLRRSRLWSDVVVSGEFHIDMAPSRKEAALPFNVHTHGIVVANRKWRGAQKLLEPLWAALLGAHGAVGKIQVKRITKVSGRTPP